MLKNILIMGQAQKIILIIICRAGAEKTGREDFYQLVLGMYYILLFKYIKIEMYKM